MHIFRQYYGIMIYKPFLGCAWHLLKVLLIDAFVMFWNYTILLLMHCKKKQEFLEVRPWGALKVFSRHLDNYLVILTFYFLYQHLTPFNIRHVNIYMYNYVQIHIYPQVSYFPGFHILNISEKQQKENEPHLEKTAKYMFTSSILTEVTNICGESDAPKTTKLS